MSCRHVFISVVLLAITVTFFTIPACLPYLLSTTSWPSSLFSPSSSRDRAAQYQSSNELTIATSSGRNRRPKRHHLTLIANVPPTYLPTVDNQRRLIVIGDIHGMNNELGHLLDEARYDSSRDHVVTLGDMVNKGPDSRGVLTRLMAMNASAVRGNHEDRLLLALDDFNSRAASVWHGNGDSHGDDDDDDDDDGSRVIEMRKRNKKILKVAKTLTAEQVRWLSHLPVILKAKRLHLYFVHAGLVPGVRLGNQDPWAVMNMRSLVYLQEEFCRKADNEINSDAPPVQQQELLQQHQQQQQHQENNDNDNDDVRDARRVIAVPTDNRAGEQWAKAWDRYTKRLSKSARWTVMYGHDARRGFTEGKYTVGLDSACVGGGSLTALIVQADARHAPFKYTKVQVPCKKYV